MLKYLLHCFLEKNYLIEALRDEKGQDFKIQYSSVLQSRWPYSKAHTSDHKTLFISPHTWTTALNRTEGSSCQQKYPWKKGTIACSTKEVKYRSYELISWMDVILDRGFLRFGGPSSLLDSCMFAEFENKGIGTFSTCQKTEWLSKLTNPATFVAMCFVKRLSEFLGQRHWHCHRRGYGSGWMESRGEEKEEEEGRAGS